MPAGTITLTNNSTVVTGSGTAFNTELKANDFLVAVVGGVTYSLGVKSVESATALTLTTTYSGPTTSGLAWTPIPNGTLVGITAQIAADTARAIRGLNYDKQNWQQVYSSSGTITVTLPDGSTFTGPSWNGVATALTGKADKSSLGTAASKNTGTTYGSVLTVGAAFGIGSDLEGYAYSRPTGLYGGPPDTPTPNYGGGLIRLSQNSYQVELFSPLAGQQRLFVRNVSASTGGSTWAEFYSTVNTTKAADGTLKAASPVVKIFHDGHAETNDESEGCTVTRQNTGEYLIEGCMGLNADAGWSGIDGGFDIPKDRNRQPLVWLDYEVNSDGSILVRTYHRTYLDAPAFASNIRDGYENGDPIDIPAD